MWFFTPRRLRSKPNEKFTERKLMRMLRRRDFYDSIRNPRSRGSGHQFEKAVFENGRVIIDHQWQLMWQDKTREWRDEISCKLLRRGYYLDDDEYAGFSDWRLPTIEEAMSLMKPPGYFGSKIALPMSSEVFPFPDMLTCDSVSPWEWWTASFSYGQAWKDYMRSVEGYHFCNPVTVIAVRSL